MNQLLARVTPLYQNKSLRRAFQITWVTLIIGFVVVAIASRWHTITSIQWTSDRLLFVGVALLATLGRRFTSGILWIWIVRLVAKDKSLRFRDSLKIYFISNLATYIPGTYWYIPGRMLMNSKHGITTLETGVCTLLEQFLVILSGALISLFAVDLVAKSLHLEIGAFWWIFMIISIGLIAIHPRTTQAIMNGMASVLKIQSVQLSLSYFVTLLLLLWAIVTWLIGAFTLLFLTKAFLPDYRLDQVGVFGAIFAMSWLIGYFTPFAPSGLGVREGVMGVAFVGIGIPLDITVLLAALSRILFIFEDVFWGAVATLLL